MTFHPLIEDLTTVSDDELAMRVSELRSRLMKAYGLGMKESVLDQIDTIVNTLQGEQSRRALAKSLEQQRGAE